MLKAVRFIVAAGWVAGWLSWPDAHAAADARVTRDEEVIRCESTRGRERFCPAPNRGGVRVVREISGSPCIAGNTFRHTRDGVYVWDGCRADFAFRPSGGSGGSGSSSSKRVSCASSRGRENFCAVDHGGRVRLLSQHGPSRCIEGESWRIEQRGIRVRNGCSALFEVGYGGSGGGWGGPGGIWGGPGGSSSGQTLAVRCESRAHRWAECPVDIRGAVRLQRQHSKAQCVRDWTWGTTGDEAIWVSDGCRASFLVEGRQAGRSARSGEGGAPPGVPRVQPR